MYKCAEYNFHKLEKRINRITKKLDKYGLSHRFEVIGTEPEEVGVYELDTINNQWVKVRTTVIDVVTYDFQMEDLRVGAWEPVAVIEHGELDGQPTNKVYPLPGIGETPEGWWAIPSTCEHCKTNRPRAKTVMLKDADGNYKQVGTTCIKDFTGIDAADIISLYSSVGDIYCEEPRIIDREYGEFTPVKYVDTVNYLAYCAKLTDEVGYAKSGTAKSTRTEAFQLALKGTAPAEYMEKAEGIISLFNSLPENLFSGFEMNIKAAVNTRYTKADGFIAYAPVAADKLEDDCRKKLNMEEQKAVSQYQGEVGGKLEVEITLEKRISYDTDYGTMTMLLFRDAAGNAYKWNTSTYVKEAKKIKGTVKDHSEYNGEKQTVLTRCKVLA